MSTPSSPSHSLEPVALDADDAEAERFFAEGTATPGDEPPEPLHGDPDEAWDEPAHAPLTAAQLARRARLRSIVTKGLAGGVLLLLAGIAFAHLPHERPTHVRSAAVDPTRARVSLARAKPILAGTQVHAAPAPPASAETALSAAAMSAAAASSTEPAPSTSAASEPAPARTSEDAHLLAVRARRLLESGRLSEGVAAARAAIEADPKRSEAYILLAAGLEDLGLWQEAQHVFASCVQHSSQGPSAECAYFAKAAR